MCMAKRYLTILSWMLLYKSLPWIMWCINSMPEVYSHRVLNTYFDTLVAKSVRFHLRNLGFIRRYLNLTTTEQLVQALISSRLDLCNSLLHDIPQCQLNRLQRLQNAASSISNVNQVLWSHQSSSEVPSWAAHMRSHKIQGFTIGFSHT